MNWTRYTQELRVFGQSSPKSTEAYLGEDLGAEGGAGDVEQVLAKSHRVALVVKGALLQPRPCNLRRLPVACTRPLGLRNDLGSLECESREYILKRLLSIISGILA